MQSFKQTSVKLIFSPQNILSRAPSIPLALAYQKKKKNKLLSHLLIRIKCLKDNHLKQTRFMRCFMVSSVMMFFEQSTRIVPSEVSICVLWKKNIDAQILHTVVIHAAIRFSLTDSKAVSSPANAWWPLAPNFCSWISQVQILALGSLQVFVSFQVDFCYSCLTE